MSEMLCAARVADECEHSLPLDDVAHRDPDGACICAECADELDIPGP
ncbi:hypothetical protein ACFQJC_05070 [Haloferax namakaokahaiae]|uniref:Small CPxCG-related zinc finger protein n=1 Tax=Haloferax namakaokahaiae TaxID=1748331 RepID=A0ABD5ZCG7_9EURY